MWPYKLLRDDILRHISEFAQEGTALEVQIQAVAKAELFLTLEGIGLGAERILYCAAAFLVACEGVFADLLGKAEGQEAILDLLLLSSDVLKRVLILVDFH